MFMDFGGGFGGFGRPPAKTTLPTIVAPFASIDANGWQADYATTPPATVLNVPYEFTATGFDAGGNVVNRRVTANTRVTRRLRDPGAATLQATKVGLSIKVPIGATVPGATNNSTQIVPVPVGNFITRFGQVLGNEDHVVEIVAGHYFAGYVAGEQIAVAKLIVSDGTTTITKLRSTTSWSTSPTDAKPVPVYAFTVTAAEMATLNNGIITYDSELLPFIGQTGTGASDTSIARTTDSAARSFPVWKFARRYNIKDVTRRATPPRCYLATAGASPAGNDSTGVWSTTDATALASPFLTMAGALAAGKISAIPAGSVIPSGTVDGCEIRVGAGTFAIGGPATAVPAYGAGLIITRSPAATRAQAILTHGSAWSLRVGQTGLQSGTQAVVIFADVTFNRSGTFNAAPAATTNFHWVGCAMDMGNVNTGITNAFGVLWFWGNSISNVFSASNSALAGATGIAVGIYRGNTIAANGANVFGYNVIGNSFTNLGNYNATAFTAQDNFTVISNVNTGDVGTTFSYAAAVDVNGGLSALNVHEWTSNVSNPVWRVSGDSATGSTKHVLEYGNTYAGAGDYGRHNDRYVDTDATASRTHSWDAALNNIRVSHNTKHDRFLPFGATRVGGWEVMQGVGYRSNWNQYIDANNGSTASQFFPDYVDPSTQTGTSGTVPLDPKFKSNQATFYSAGAYQPGAGGGNYRLQRVSEGDAADSPCLTLATQTLYPGFGKVLGAYP